jgi:predicted small lipoprotein YifL
MRPLFLAILALSLTLMVALAGCGKYGPPVRSSEKKTAPAVIPSEALEEDSQDDRKDD